MKKKTIALERKLLLTKNTVTPLTLAAQMAVAGGATVNNPGCVGSNHCTALECTTGLTKEETCTQLTKECSA